VNGRRLATFAATTAAASALAAIAACASVADESSLGTSPDAGGFAPPPSDAGASSDAGGLLPVSEGVLVVHGASLPALRLCFTRRRADPPIPLDVIMPESNVVGIDVGAVVRLPNLDGDVGDVVAFPERELRGQLTTADGGAITSRYSCGDLLDSSTFAASALAFGPVSADLSRGVSVLALLGCQGSAKDPRASKARCGATWTPELGNLDVVARRVEAEGRASLATLPVQVVQLSPSLDVRAAGASLAFGVEDGDAGVKDEIASLFVLGAPTPQVPRELALPARGGDLDYGATKLVIDVLRPATDGGADAGALRERVLAQSLEETQRLTLPEGLPPAFWSSVSSFLLLSVGELVTDGELPDAGRDPRSRLHLLAVPLAATPARDAGAPR
jgi:hypothetical protein